ncbi:hypothetical protein TNCT6_35750 [Streptomyces sp. 6-11-2]|nr:hypothetical protein TNCT6_35750 [Streptomyces sp. 6-11-2]
MTPISAFAMTSTLVPRQATFAPSRRPARSSELFEQEDPRSAHGTPLLDGRTLPAAAPASAHTPRTPPSHDGGVPEGRRQAAELPAELVDDEDDPDDPDEEDEPEDDPDEEDEEPEEDGLDDFDDDAALLLDEEPRLSLR